MSAIRVLVKKPGEGVRIRVIEDSAEAFQEVIGCRTVRNIMLEDDLALLVDDDGKLKQSPPNLIIPGHLVVGTVIFAGVKGDKLASISAEHTRGIISAFGMEAES